MNVTRPAASTTGEVVVAVFDSYCNGVPSKFDTKQISSSDGNNCGFRNVTDNYNRNSVTVLFSFDQSGCGNSGLTTGAIVGIAVAAGVVAIIAIASVSILCFKNKIRPFSNRSKPNGTRMHTDL